MRVPETSTDDNDRVRMTLEPRNTGSGLVFVSHNWCDPTTWHQESVRAEAETLTDSGDGLTFESAHSNWIDLVHGKIYREDLISTGKLPVVQVDGAAKTLRAPWATSGGDYEIDYVSGDVTFFASQAGKSVVASYNYAASSLFTVAPAAGKNLWIEYSEVQFSKDISINGTIHFQPWAYNPADLPNKVAAGAPTTYKTMDNFIEEANGAYPVIPAMGGTRGFVQDRLTFPFRYLTLKDLHSVYGVEIRVWIDGDQPFGGEYATATFYGTSLPEAT